MDYVDYKEFMKKNWKKDERLHRNRLNEIQNSPSNRIDNKPSEYHFTAPCKKKKEKTNIEIDFESGKHYSTMCQISSRNLYKEVRDQVNKNIGFPAYAKNRKNHCHKEVKSENLRIYQKLATVKSQFSLKTWDKEYELSTNYSKRIAKPHIDNKLPLLSSKKLSSTRHLIDSYSLASF